MATTTPRENRLRDAIDAHYDVVWRFLRRLGVPEPDIEDAAQRVLLVLAGKLASVKPGSERSFLLGTAVRVASEVRRARTRVRDVAFDDTLVATHADPSPRADERIDEHRMRRMLDQVLDALPDDLRSVLVLVDLEEQTMAEASLVLGIPPGTVASRLKRARETFEHSVHLLKNRIDQGAVR